MRKNYLENPNVIAVNEMNERALLYGSNNSADKQKG